MKIAIISTAFPYRGGIAQYTGILYERLRDRGHEVIVITFRRQYPKILFPGKTQLESNQASDPRITSERILDSIGPWTWFTAFKRLKEFCPDLILFKFWMPFFAPCFGSICWLAKKYLDSKIVYICDNVIPHEKRPGDIALTKFAFKKADGFIVQSHVVEKDLLSLYPRAEYRYVPHPVYDIFGETLSREAARTLLNVDDAKVILFFGYVRKYKGLDLLVQAMPEILTSVKIKLMIVGEFYADEAGFRKMIEDRGVADQVLIHSGFVPDEQVNKYFSAADVVVLPYKSATQSGIVQLSYHFNKPCIVTDVGGLAEVVVDGKTGYVVRPNDPGAIARAVVQFYAEDREFRFSENVKAEKQKYSWDRMLDALEEIAID